jgi:hypothetical protein
MGDLALDGRATRRTVANEFVTPGAEVKVPRCCFHERFTQFRWYYKVSNASRKTMASSLDKTAICPSRRS